jgi:hypothetical protein
MSGEVIATLSGLVAFVDDAQAALERLKPTAR